jgi:hypothetical protein
MSLLMAFLPALWLLLFVFPPTVAGNHAEHNAMRIVKPAGPINPGGSNTAFAHIQEKGEFRLHKLLAIAAGLPFVFVAPEPLALGLFAQALVMAAVDSFSRKIEAIDFAGHGAEIIAAERAGDWTYRAAEIARMQGDRDKRGQNVAALLLRWEWLARIVWWLGRW